MVLRGSPYYFQRRPTREVRVGDPARGGVILGGRHPVVVQSMITCDTMDTAACVQQTLELARVGCQLVRITAPTVKDAANLEHIAAALRARGCLVPLVADIHFKPEAALEAAQWVEKVRINPGNYADSKKFAVKEYSDAQYAEELERIAERFAPLVRQCRELGRALRIGVNHGSLSDRIMNRYGDSPRGMVESALEFARIARAHDFHQLVFSMKASNPKVVIECYRLLAARFAALGPDWNYPLHLGVTEAGEGEDGRIKSAIGIGSLLGDGLGDTIRVSLTEDSPQEIPVCHALLAQVPELSVQDPAPKAESGHSWPFDPFVFERRRSVEVALPGGPCGGDHPVRVVVSRAHWEALALQLSPKAEVKPEGVYEDLNVCEVDPARDFQLPSAMQWVTVKDGTGLPAIAAFRLLAAKLAQLGRQNPILLKDCLLVPGIDLCESIGTRTLPDGRGSARGQHPPTEPRPSGSVTSSEPAHTSAKIDRASRPGEPPPAKPLDSATALLRASVVLGSLLADGIGDAILIRGEPHAGPALRLAYNLLQAAGCRSFKTDYVACPSCGRTLFDLQSVTARIKERTRHLKGVKIAIMGCIVNGPGEMADADFGYVGGAPGKVNLYVGKKPVKFNIPEAQAVDRLVDLIREHGKWVDAS